MAGRDKSSRQPARVSRRPAARKKPAPTSKQGPRTATEDAPSTAGPSTTKPANTATNTNSVLDTAAPKTEANATASQTARSATPSTTVAGPSMSGSRKKPSATTRPSANIAAQSPLLQPLSQRQAPAAPSSSTATPSRRPRARAVPLKPESATTQDLTDVASRPIVQPASRNKASTTAKPVATITAVKGKSKAKTSAPVPVLLQNLQPATSYRSARPGPPATTSPVPVQKKKRKLSISESQPAATSSTAQSRTISATEGSKQGPKSNKRRRLAVPEAIIKPNKVDKEIIVNLWNVPIKRSLLDDPNRGLRGLYDIFGCKELSKKAYSQTTNLYTRAHLAIREFIPFNERAFPVFDEEAYEELASDLANTREAFQGRELPLYRLPDAKRYLGIGKKEKLIDENGLYHKNFLKVKSWICFKVYINKGPANAIHKIVNCAWPVLDKAVVRDVNDTVHYRTPRGPERLPDIFYYDDEEYEDENDAWWEGSNRIESISQLRGEDSSSKMKRHLENKQKQVQLELNYIHDSCFRKYRNTKRDPRFQPMPEGLSDADRAMFITQLRRAWCEETLKAWYDDATVELEFDFSYLPEDLSPQEKDGIFFEVLEQLMNQEAEGQHLSAADKLNMGFYPMPKINSQHLELIRNNVWQGLTQEGIERLQEIIAKEKKRETRGARFSTPPQGYGTGLDRSKDDDFFNEYRKCLARSASAATESSSNNSTSSSSS